MILRVPSASSDSVMYNSTVCVNYIRNPETNIILRLSFAIMKHKDDAECNLYALLIKVAHKWSRCSVAQGMNQKYRRCRTQAWCNPMSENVVSVAPK